jgi:tetratricopeptide (TPR) repeat protein
MLSDRRTLAVAAALAALAFLTFLPALGHGFLVYDDDQYVTANRPVLGGLSASAAGWALTSGHAANWHPLTWLSHMTDVTLWGTEPRGHHLTNLVLHAANAAVLFLALRALAGSFWPCALVAALFAVHPTRIEAVAWVAERKELLSALLGFLSLLAYARWARGGARGQPWSALVLFALGLLAKPMLVSLPFVMVLLDAWPLERVPLLRERPVRALARALLEKAPFLVLAAVSSVTTFLVQRAGGAVGTLDSYPIGVRVANALVAYAGYLRRFFWPVGLAVFYPHPGRSLGVAAVAGAAVLLAGLGTLAWLARARRPYLFVGWSWFAGMLVPVIGLVQVGFQALADRYTYVTFVGLWIALVWLAADALATRSAVWRRAAAGVAALLLAACVVQTRRELVHWKDSETLFRRALAVTRDNYVAHQNLAHHLNELNRPAEALPHLEEALRIRPRYPEAQVNLGRSLFLLGRVDEAIPHFESARALRPEDPVALNNLAFSRMNQGDLAETVRLYGLALGLQPDWAEVQHRAGVVEVMQGDLEGGGARLTRAAELEPGHAEYEAHARGWAALRADRNDGSPAARAFLEYLVTSHRQAADVLARRGRLAEAAEQLERAAAWLPSRADLHQDAGLAWSRAGDTARAMRAFQAATAAEPSLPSAHNNLGYMLFLQGDRSGAIARYREALRLAPDFALARNNLALALDGRAPAARATPAPR